MQIFTNEMTGGNTMGIVHEGFEAFRKGTLGCSGANLFVDAKGVVRRIAEQDLDGDGCFDIIFPNTCINCYTKLYYEDILIMVFNNYLKDYKYL